jgi:transcriptional regulator with XRE-family HTH domain
MKFNKTILPDYEYFRLLRLYLKVSTLEVERKTKVSRATLWRFESGKEVMYDNVCKLNSYYNTLL